MNKTEQKPNVREIKVDIEDLEKYKKIAQEIEVIAQKLGQLKISQWQLKKMFDNLSLQQTQLMNNFKIKYNIKDNEQGDFDPETGKIIIKNV